MMAIGIGLAKGGKLLPSLRLTAQFAPENGWLEDDPASFWCYVSFRRFLVILVELDKLLMLI